MAMKIGGYYDPEIIIPSRWEKLANECNFSYTQLKKMILRQAINLPKAVNKASADINNPIASKIRDFVALNCQKTIDKF